MITLPTVLERLTRVTPLGLRFWDPVSRAVVGEGLNVVVYPPHQPERRTPTLVTRAGIYAAQNLPGLRALEYGAGDEDYWDALPPKRPFVVEVVDAQSRFQPFRFTADLPARDLFILNCLADGSPPAAIATVPLFSSPSRPVPGAMAVIRAELRDARDTFADRPAAWARIEAYLNGQLLASGVADRKGRFALILPYPEPAPDATGTRPPLVRQKWSIELRAFYAPGSPVPEIPDLCEVLEQAPASLWRTLSPPTPLPDVTLEFGKELVVKSQPYSILWIAPAGSPP